MKKAIVLYALSFALVSAQVAAQISISNDLLTFSDGTEQSTAAASPDVPCFSLSNQFVDCGNGTVSDSRGLIWLENANCFGQQDYVSANASATSLATGQCGLTDGSGPGDWRLPTVEEWQQINVGGCFSPSLVGNGSPAVGCFAVSPWASLVVSDPGSRYWSSTTNPTISTRAESVRLDAGLIGAILKTDSTPYVWPVRASAIRKP